MKKFKMLLVGAGIIVTVVPHFADASVQRNSKDDCLLLSHPCATTMKTLNEQRAALQAEVNKGEEVYSRAEVDKLSAKLAEVDNTLHNLTTR